MLAAPVLFSKYSPVSACVHLWQRMLPSDLKLEHNEPQTGDLDLSPNPLGTAGHSPASLATLLDSLVVRIDDMTVPNVQAGQSP